MKNFILFIALLLGANAFAQEQLSIRDAVLGLRDGALQCGKSSCHRWVSAPGEGTSVTIRLVGKGAA